WFFEAARAYLAYTGDLEFVRDELYPVFADIVLWHVRGTRYGIKVDPSGLLSSGEPGVQLTWMDAKVGDWVVTPRRGKPVEIQALWYNALRIMEELAQQFEDEAGVKRYRNMAAVASWSFNRLFWNENTGCLYDVTNGSSAAREQAAEWLKPLQNHLCEAGLGHISEIFEGDAPHQPCGCMAQAWSVAEILRAYVEDVKGIRPVWKAAEVNQRRANEVPVAIASPV